jgi:hypothetical protein
MRSNNKNSSDVGASNDISDDIESSSKANEDARVKTPEYYGQRSLDDAHICRGSSLLPGCKEVLRNHGSYHSYTCH